MACGGIPRTYTTHAPAPPAEASLVRRLAELQPGLRFHACFDQLRVYEEGLWVMEAKGADAEVSPATLGQVRDYAIHPEVRAALVVTVDAAGFRIFDP